MNTAPRLRYELAYTIDGPIDAHETWLLEWTLDWHERSEVSDVEIARRETADGTEIEIVVECEATDPSAIDFDDHRDLIDQLEAKSNTLVVTYRSVEQE